MYNPYQRKLIRDMIMNVVLSLFLIVNLLPVNIGARIVAEENPSEPGTADVLDSEKQNDNENKEENPSGEDDLSGGSDQENNNEENPADGTKTDEGVPAEGSGTKDETPNEGGSNDDTPVVENDKIIDEEDKKDDKINEEENPEEEKKEGEILLGAKAGGMTLLAADDGEGGGTRAVSGIYTIPDSIDFGKTGTFYFIDSKNPDPGNPDRFRCSNNPCPVAKSSNTDNDHYHGTGDYKRYEFDLGNGNATQTTPGKNTIKLNHTKVVTGLKGFEISGTGSKEDPFAFELVFNPATVTWKDGDGNIIETDYVEYVGPEADHFGATPSYDGNTPEKTPTKQISYKFNGVWKDENGVVLTSDYVIKNNTTFTAQFSEEARKYTITWKDGDNKTLKTEQVAYGNDPNYSGNTPTKKSTDQYDYTFNNTWLPVIESVTEDATYTAQFTPVTRKYNVIWKNGETVLETDIDVEYGTNPTYESDEPTREKTAQYEYTFSGWKDQNNNPYTTDSTVTGPMTYTAQFDAVPIEYTIGYNLDGGNVSPANPTEYNVETETFTLTNPTKEHYNFLGWTGTGLEELTEEVTIAKGSTGNRTYIAHWEAASYSIAYNLDGGTIPEGEKNPDTYTIMTETFTLTNPTKANFDFVGWSGTDITDTSETVTIAKGSYGDRTYKANWKGKKLTITFDSQEGSAPDPSTKDVYYGEKCGELPKVDRIGYTFDGWYTGKTGGKKIENDTIVKVTGKKTLYAHWTANKYIVTFASNGGKDLSPTSIEVTYDSTYGDLATVKKDNYIFTGWYTEDGNEITSDSKVTIAGHHILYAGWIGKEIKVSFNINYEGGTNPDQKTVNYDSAYGDLPEVTREGYGFGGWWYESDITEYQVSPNTKVSDLNDHTLKARWTANTYTVKFESNGGSTPSPASKEVTYGKAYGDFPVVNKEGYSFDGWFTAAEGGTRIGEADPVHITTDQTLYAHWTAKTYSLRFRSNGGGNPSVRYKTVTYDSEYGELASIEREGYTFAGWYTRRSGGTQVLPEDIVKITADQTLYAHWTANTYKVSFNMNGSLDPDPAPIEVTYGQRYGTLPSVTRVGYEFDGWYTAETGGTRVRGRTTVQTASDHILYAHWTANTYTVRFNSNGGGNPSVRYKSVTYDSEYGELATIEREGYTFAGWFTAAEGGTQVSPEDKVKITANQTLYAHWTANTYTVTFDSNGGRRPSPRRITVTYDSQYGELATTRRTGYTFAGWFTAAEGGTQVSPEDKVKITANQTLYAHWTANTYTVSFDKNGSVDPDPASKVVTYGQRYGSLPSVTRVGYEFDGWYTARTGGTQVNWRTTVQTASDHTLYAHWTAEKYTVTFDSNGGRRPSPRRITVTYDSQYGTLPTVTRDGYTFAGWYYESGAMKFEVKPTDIVSVPEDHTLKAYWTANTYTITFNSNGGSDPDPTSKEVTYDQLYGDLPIVTREGYTSEGWYTRQNDGRKITASDTVKITRDRTFYTHWTVIEYPITYNNVSEAVVTNPDKYTVEDSFTLNNPVRQGFDFLGWTGSNGENPQLEVTVSKGTTGELIFNANWQEIEYDDVTGSTVEHVRGVDGDEKFTFKRNIRDEKTYANFVAADRVVKVDGNKLNEKQFEAHSGSLIIVLKKDYLDSLTIGEHLLSVDFLDGDRLFTVTTKFYIRMKPADTDSHVIPTTGIQSESEGGNFYRTISMFAILALGATIKLRNKVGKDYWDEFK